MDFIIRSEAEEVMKPYMKRGEVGSQADLKQFNTKVRVYGHEAINLLSNALRRRGVRVGCKNPEVNLTLRDICVVEERNEKTGKDEIVGTTTIVDISVSDTGECIHTWEHTTD